MVFINNRFLKYKLCKTVTADSKIRVTIEFTCRIGMYPVQNDGICVVPSLALSDVLSVSC